jgi:hypothetical protein
MDLLCAVVDRLVVTLCNAGSHGSFGVVAANELVCPPIRHSSSFCHAMTAIAESAPKLLTKTRILKPVDPVIERDPPRPPRHDAERHRRPGHVHGPAVRHGKLHDQRHR